MKAILFGLIFILSFGTAALACDGSHGAGADSGDSNQPAEESFSKG